PISGAIIKLYEDYRRDNLGRPIQLVTDASGKVTLPNNNRRYANWLMVAEKGDDKLAEAVNSRRDRPTSRTRNRVHFFLDRGIYRPGQTMYAKGIAVHYDENAEPSLVTQETMTVYLTDVNGQRVGEQEVVTDMYGAFQLSFLLPESGLNGRYTLACSLGGSTSLRVEAYKRPRFEVSFDAYEEAIEAGQEVTVMGHALGFAGPAVSDGRVTYRVVRETVSYWYFYGGGAANVEAVLATGQTKTAEDGSFQITFPANVPTTKSGPSWRRPSYRFVVYADVADQTGETHAGKTSVFLRSKAPAVSLEVPGLIDRSGDARQEVTVNFKPADEETTTLRAQVNIQAIRNPNPSVINRYWSVPDRPVISKSDFARQFPLYAYGEERPMEQWPLKRMVNIPNATQEVLLGVVKSFPINVGQLPVGHYRITISYPDGEGGEAKTLSHFSIYDAATAELPSGKNNLLIAEKATVPPGEDARLQLLTQAPISNLLYDWQSRKFNSGVQYLTAAKGHRFVHSVTDDDRGGLQFNTLYVKYNRLYNLNQRFQVPWPTKELEITYETFRDKLRPGEDEEWRIRVKDHLGEPVSAQLLASMYDASLDAISPFDWSGDLSFYANGFYSPQRFSSRSFTQASAYGRLDKMGYQSNRTYLLPSLDFSPLRFGYGFGRPMAYMAEDAVEMEGMDMRVMRSSAPAAPSRKISAVADTNIELSFADESGSVGNEPPPVDIRTNLGETAFFQPEIRVDENGEATINFTSPEALTKWKLQLLTHTTELAYAYETKEVVTQKELMVLPNAPRFMREDDELVFTAKVSNLSEQQLTGQATLEFFEPETDVILTSEVAMLDAKPAADFTLEPGKSETVKFRIKVAPNSAGLIGYRVIARAGNFSDGEQNVLPILSNRIFLTATKSFFLRPNQKKTVALEALLNSAKSDGNIENKGFTF
ncbi:MAG: alpha-2-macroglobulin family protein, partial [Bacteroidota bacterium]